jgi:hypothetical protein
MEFGEVHASGYNPEGAHGVFWEYFRFLQAEAGGSLPNRYDFDPLKIASILPKMAMSEFVDVDTQIVRIIGGGHDGLWPTNMAGRNLFDFLEPHMVETRKAAYKEITARPCGCIINDIATDSEGHRLAHSGLILPTLSASGDPTMFIGCYEFQATHLEIETASELGIASRETKSVTLVALHL